MKERKGFLYYFVRNRNGMIGMIGVLLILLIGLVGPMLIAKPDGYTQDILQAPSALHWLGTDNIGLDIFAELVWGARTSLYVSVMAMLIAGVIGIPVGLLCGYNTGWLREVIDGFIRQGVTTLVNGNCSHSITPGHKKEVLDYYLGNGLVGLKQYQRYLRDWPDWHDFEGYPS